MAYNILCEVWGVTTAWSSSSLMKQDGKVREFATREEAQMVADQNMERTMGDPHRTASFCYSVVDGV